MDPRDPRRIKASLAMFERLSEHWSLRGDEREILLGGISKSTWGEWKHRAGFARIKLDTRERIANLFTIDLNAHALFAPEFADRWVRQPNAAFGGKSPLATMLRGRLENIITVRRYLERVRSSSPTADVGSPGADHAEKLLVSYLPDSAGESGGDEAELPALRHAAAIYENLAQREPALYRPALAAALTSLGNSLERRDDAEAVPILRRAAELVVQVTSERPARELPSDETDDCPAGGWRIGFSPAAISVVQRLEFLDESFNRALRARIRALVRDPFNSSTSTRLPKGLRAAHMTHHGVRWSLYFFLAVDERELLISSVNLSKRQR